MRFLNNIYSSLIIVGVILFILLYTCFGERGLIRVLDLKKELKEIESCNQNIRAESVALKESIYRLKNDKRYVERDRERGTGASENRRIDLLLRKQLKSFLK